MLGLRDDLRIGRGRGRGRGGRLASGGRPECGTRSPTRWGGPLLLLLLGSLDEAGVSICKNGFYTTIRGSE